MKITQTINPAKLVVGKEYYFILFDGEHFEFKKERYLGIKESKRFTLYLDTQITESVPCKVYNFGDIEICDRNLNLNNAYEFNYCFETREDAIKGLKYLRNQKIKEDRVDLKARHDNMTPSFEATLQALNLTT